MTLRRLSPPAAAPPPGATALMGKRLVMQRGGLAVIDAEPSDDWGDADSIGGQGARVAQAEVVSILRSVEIILEQTDYRTQKSKRGAGIGLIDEECVGVDFVQECEKYAGRGEVYITLLRDVGRDMAGDVLLTPLPAAQAQSRNGLSRLSYGWEVVAAAVSGGPAPAFGGQLSVAHRLHGRRAMAGGRAATWPS